MVVNALREAMKDNNSFVLQVDFQNAFNSPNRGTTYNKLFIHFPELAHWVATCYGVEAVHSGAFMGGNRTFGEIT